MKTGNPKVLPDVISGDQLLETKCDKILSRERGRGEASVS
jgi:hypothetical protein